MDKPKMNLLVALLGMKKPAESEMSDESETESEDLPEEGGSYDEAGREAAAREIMSAIKADDAKLLGRAMQHMIDCCGSSEEE